MPTDPGSRLIRTRAMNRALGRLRDRYRDEYEQLFAAELEAARAEAAGHVAASRVEHAGELPPVKTAPQSGPPFLPRSPVPPMLIPGPPPRAAVEAAAGSRPPPRMREEVARCPYCQRFHDSGHACPSCRSRPAPKPGPTVRADDEPKHAQRLQQAEWRAGPAGRPLVHYWRRRWPGREAGDGIVSLCGALWRDLDVWDGLTPIARCRPALLLTFCARCANAVDIYSLPRIPLTAAEPEPRELPAAPERPALPAAPEPGRQPEVTVSREDIGRMLPAVEEVPHLPGAHRFVDGGEVVTLPQPDSFVPLAAEDRQRSREHRPSRVTEILVYGDDPRPPEPVGALPNPTITPGPDPHVTDRLTTSRGTGTTADDVRRKVAAVPPRTIDDGRTYGLCRACSSPILVTGHCKCTRTEQQT